tara:strand:- start:1166 stop:1624 length:459 start_codon:yes stop_codon:yes gene_type:complete
MNIEKLINVVGVLGVIASLIFVGLELRQSQQIALGAAAQARLDALAAPRLAVLQTAPNAFKAPSGNISFDEYEMLTDDEKAIWELRSSTGALNLQNALMQNELGLMPEVLWEQAEERAIGGWANCLVRPILLSQLTIDFQAYLETKVSTVCE